MTGKAQAPDEVEEEGGSEDAVERSVGEEETGVVADGPGQVLPRETRLDREGPSSLGLWPHHS